MSGHFAKEFQDGREKRVTRVPGVPKLSGRGQSVKRLAIPNDSSQRQFGHVHWVAEFPDRDTFWNGDTCGTKALAQRLQEIQGGKTPKTKDPRPGFIKICAPVPACLARSVQRLHLLCSLLTKRQEGGAPKTTAARPSLDSPAICWIPPKAPRLPEEVACCSNCAERQTKFVKK